LRLLGVLAEEWAQVEARIAALSQEIEALAMEDAACQRLRRYRA
jgi:uncharacterized small protein (DUF1192 family)